MSKDVGGAAFPSANERFVSPGMTLRDYFAGQVIDAVIRINGEFKPEIDAMMAYKYADAMIAERGKK